MDVQNSVGHRGSMSAAMFPEAKRLNTWRELFGRQFLHLDVDPLDDEPFRYDVDYIAMPDLNLSSGSISAVRCNRPHELIDDGNDDLILLAPQSGKMELHERGKEALIRQGDAFIRRSSEIGHTFSTSGNYLTLSIPSDKVGQRVPNMEQFGFAVVQNSNRTLSLLKNYLQMLMSGNLVPPENDDLARHTAEMISRHIHEVVGLLLGASRDSWECSCEPGGGLFATRIAAIYAEVAHKATDPDFSVHHVAQKFEISPGYIRKLLATQEQRFSDLLRSARLDHAHRMLRAPHVIHVDITRIALDSGFNDISYFNRCFKQRFGMTPSDVRNGLADPLGE